MTKLRTILPLIYNKYFEETNQAKQKYVNIKVIKQYFLEKLLSFGDKNWRRKWGYSVGRLSP